MKKRIYKNFLGLAVLTILLISGIFVYFYNQSIHREMEEQVRTEAFCTAAAFETKRNDLEYLNRIKQKDILRITLISEEGKVLYDSAASVYGLDSHLERPEVQEAIRDGEGSATRLSHTLQTDNYYYAVKLSDGRVLRLAKEVKSSLQMFLEVLPLLLGVAALILLCTWLIAHRLAHGIAEKVNEIDLQDPMENPSFEELLPLLHRINKQNVQIGEQVADLKEQEGKFRAITCNMSEGLILLDLRARILFINQSCKDLFDMPTISFEGKHISTFNGSEQLLETVSMALKGESYSAMLRLPEKQVEFFGNPVREDGDVTGAVLFVLDVTADQKAEQLRKEFSANVSHELKTPLTSISGYAELMMNGLVQPEDVPSFSAKIFDEARRLLSLVNDIIKISRLDEKVNRLTKEQINLYEMAEEICTQLHPAAEKASVSVKLEGEAVTIFAVRQLIYDLIYNLVENAIKYNVEGGSVTAEIHEKDDQAVIRVSDTGIGISMEYQERIFERFYRIDKSHSRQTGGTGLGLSIVKHVVEYQGGYIEIHSNPGEGTVITVHLQG